MSISQKELVKHIAEKINKKDEVIEEIYQVNNCFF